MDRKAPDCHWIFLIVFCFFFIAVEGTPTATGQATNPAVVGATPVGTPAIGATAVGAHDDCAAPFD